MTFPRLALRTVALPTALAAAFLLAACGSSGPSAAPSNQAAATGAAIESIEVPTFDLGTFVVPSFAIPSFGSDEALEALLPDEIGGMVVVKASMTGAAIRNMPGGAALEAQLGALGATVDDVSVAIGTAGDAATPVVIFAYQIAGVSADQIFQGLEAALQAGQGGQLTQTTVAGREVTQVTSGGETTYIYLAGDVVFIIGGQLTPELLEDAISQLPA
jgi:hypothetical protein